MVKRHTNTGALLLLLAMAAGGVLLAAGLSGPAPARAGVRLPARESRLFVSHAGMGHGRAGPGQGGRAAAVPAQPLGAQLEEAVSGAEARANAALDRGHLFIQLYGGVERLLQRTVLEDVDPDYDVVKLSDGTLTFVNAEPRDTSGHGRAVSRLARVLAGRDIPLLYVQAPQKLQRDDPRLPAGVVDHGDDYADALLAVLEEEGVAFLDLRETFAATGEDWSSFFFRTDHHWTPAAAFLAHQTLSGVLKRDYGFDFPERNTDPDAFLRTSLSDFFLGSQGKRVGSLYAGVDDFEVWRPRFYTNFTYSVPFYDLERTGSFEHSLLFPERLEEMDYFGGNPYTFYAGGDYPMARIYNEQNPDGKRILLLRDSYACVLTPFLALNCGELITIDLRYFQDDLLTYVDWLEPDLVVVLYTAGSAALEELFSFFPSGEPYLDDYRDAPPAAEKPPLGGG